MRARVRRENARHFGKNSRKTVSVSKICDDYCSFIGGNERKEKEKFFSASSPLLFKAALPCPPKPLSN